MSAINVIIFLFFIIIAFLSVNNVESKIPSAIRFFFLPLNFKVRLYTISMPKMLIYIVLNNGFLNGRKVIIICQQGIFHFANEIDIYIWLLDSCVVRTILKMMECIF